MSQPKVDPTQFVELDPAEMDAQNLLCNPNRTAENKSQPAKKLAADKIRWKNLEQSKRQELEEERRRVIEAYRKLKNK